MRATVRTDGGYASRSAVDAEEQERARFVAAPGASGGARARRLIARTALRPVGLVALVACLWGTNIGFRTWSGAPRPVIHDEFSYLLAADTFVHGRLTNPTPRAPAAFETFHELVKPTRASKYPPGQGLVLALGTLLGGHPFVGVWLGGLAFCLAAAWMLRAFAPPAWALAGAALAAVHPQTVEWGLSYWGGLVAAAGAAVVVGALARLRRTVRPRWALLFALGASALALTRPFEGAVLCAVSCGVFVALRTAPWRVLATRALVPAVVGLLPLAAFTLVYNKAVTGDPLLMPYTVYQRAHIQTPAFLWQPIDTTVVHRHPVMSTFEQKWIKRYNDQHTWAGFLEVKGKVVRRLLTGFAVSGAVLLPTALAVPLWWRRRCRQSDAQTAQRARSARGHVPRNGAVVVGLGLSALCALVLMPETYGHNHYVPWGLAAAVLLAVWGSRVLAASSGRRWVAWAAYGLILAVCVGVAAPLRAKRVKRELRARFETEERLNALPGRHIVFVRYGEDHSPYNEWVYNPAELDDAKVLFVRDLGRSNSRLLRAMPDRTPWLARVSKKKQRVEPLRRGGRGDPGVAAPTAPQSTTATRP